MSAIHSSSLRQLKFIFPKQKPFTSDLSRIRIHDFHKTYSP